MKMLPSLIYIP